MATPTETRCFVAVTSRGDAHSCDLPTWVYRSVDGGVSWEKVLESETLEVRGWWFDGERGHLDAVRPCAGITEEPFETTDGGRTWTFTEAGAPESRSSAAELPACRVHEAPEAWVIERRDGAGWAQVARLAKKWPAGEAP